MCHTRHIFSEVGSPYCPEKWNFLSNILLLMWTAPKLEYGSVLHYQKQSCYILLTFLKEIVAIANHLILKKLNSFFVILVVKNRVPYFSGAVKTSQNLVTRWRKKPVVKNHIPLQAKQVGDLLKSGTNKFHSPVCWVPLGVYFL